MSRFVLSRYLPFVHLQHVGDTLATSRLRWIVQAGSRATWASLSTSLIRSGISARRVICHPKQRMSDAWIDKCTFYSLSYYKQWKQRRIGLSLKRTPFLKWGCWTTEQEHDPVWHAQRLYTFPASPSVLGTNGPATLTVVTFLVHFFFLWLLARNVFLQFPQDFFDLLGGCRFSALKSKFHVFLF